MSTGELRRLAYLVFSLTRREIWLGGIVKIYGTTTKKGKPNWPKNVTAPDWSVGVTWSLSPVVRLGEHDLRVCVSSGSNQTSHTVRVFCDGELQYPGGHYTQKDYFGSPVLQRWLPASWSARIAKLERRDGGKIGPIDRRDLLIAEAEARLEVPKITHDEPEAPTDPLAISAVREVERALMERTGG